MTSGVTYRKRSDLFDYIEPAEASAFPAAGLLECSGLVRLCRVVEIPFAGLRG